MPTKLVEPGFDISIKVRKIADDKNQTAVSAGSLRCLNHVGKLIVLAVVRCFSQALIKRETVVDES